jgi:hypothetical protein
MCTTLLAARASAELAQHLYCCFQMRSGDLQLSRPSSLAFCALPIVSEHFSGMTWWALGLRAADGSRMLAGQAGAS